MSTARRRHSGSSLPTGINSTTGIAGLTLGGGFGWLTRKFGMTIDHLISAEIVTADGKLVRASASENPDLFWAIRGGGGNFGVVTNFEFMLQPLGTQVLSGLVVHPFADAKDILARYQAILAKASNNLTCWSVMRKAPPLPFLPAEWHGREVLILAMCWAGDMAEGEKAMAELRGAGNADRRRRLAASVRRLADGVRSAAHAGRAQLLEDPRFREARRRSDRHA